MPFTNPISIITGSLIAGVANGARVVIDKNGITVYNSTGSVQFQFNTDLAGVNQNILNVDMIATDAFLIGALSPVDGTHTGQMEIDYLYVLDGVTLHGAAIGVDKLLQFYDLSTFVLTDPVTLQNGNKRILDSRHVQMLDAAPSGNLTLTIAYQDIPGMSIALTTLTPNAKVKIDGTFDFNTTVVIGAGGLNTVQLLVDGVIPTVTPYTNANVVDRRSCSGSWVMTIPNAGAHTIKVQAKKSINAGTVVHGTAARMALISSEIG
jgi:hypothetical protein